MNKKLNISDFQYDPQEMARQFLLAISRGGGNEILEHMRLVLLALVSRADKPEAFQPFLRLVTAMKDGVDVRIGKATEIHGSHVKGVPALDALVPKAKSPEEMLPKGSVKYLRRLGDLGILDENLQLRKEPDENPTTRSEAMYIVYCICGALGKDRIQWKPFQDFWGVDNLAQEKWKWENRGSMSPRRSIIDKAFKEL